MSAPLRAGHGDRESGRWRLLVRGAGGGRTRRPWRGFRVFVSGSWKSRLQRCGGRVIRDVVWEADAVRKMEVGV